MSSDTQTTPTVPLKFAQDISEDGTIINHLWNIATHLEQGKSVVLTRDMQTQAQFLHNLHTRQIGIVISKLISPFEYPLAQLHWSYRGSPHTMHTHLSSSCAWVDIDGTLSPSIAVYPGVEVSATLNGSNRRMEISRIGMKKSRMEMARISYSVHSVTPTKQAMTSSLEGAKSLWDKIIHNVEWALLWAEYLRHMHVFIAVHQLLLSVPIVIRLSDDHTLAIYPGLSP